MTTKRRDFLKSAGGIAVAFSWSVPTALAQQAARPFLPGSLGTNRMLDGWIRVNPAGTITVFTGKCELGQGILTALAQIAAEELDVAYERVEIVSADTARTPNEGMTAGSLSVENSGTALRLACADARQILLELAAAKLGVAVANLSVADGTVTGAGSVTYWELAREANLKREVSAQAKPKPPAQHGIVGRSIPRRDIPAKMTGGAAFVQDLRFPGMVHGRVVRPPRYGARLDSFDEAKVTAMPGVIAVVRDGSFLGVVARREEQAINARLVLIASANWSGGSELPDPTKMYGELMSLRSEERVIGAKDAPVPAGATVIEATYHRPYQAHAAIAPSCAVAEFKDGKLRVFTHSQGVFPLRATLARALGLEPRDIRCIHAEGAGCYGHNGADDVAFDAAVLARAVDGRPVRVQWMRDDEFKWEPYGPAMTMKVKGAIASGRVVDWTFDVWSQSHNTRPGDPDGINLLGSWYLADAKRPGPARHAAQPNGAGDRNAITLYDFPRQRTTHHLIMDNPLRTSALRALGAYANVFAIESFMDELAAAGDGALDFHGHGRAVGLPLELVVTHPLQPHGPPIDRARQHGGVESNVVVAVVTVAASAFGVDAADVARREIERPGEGGTQREDALAMGPNRKLAVLELGHRAGGRDRGMRLIGPMVRRLDRLGAGRHGRVLLADHPGLAAQ
jgi:CO/xanthine dehydrogenase Mo-binding subunit